MVALGSGLSAQAQGQGTTVRLVRPAEPPTSGGPPFAVSVVVDNVVDLGAFEFDLTYDPAALKFVDIQQGPFVGSSGREVRCLRPRTEQGSVRLTCLTLGAKPDGPNSSGELAAVTFQPLAPGSSALRFARAIVTDAPAQPLRAHAQDATITISAATESGGGGFAWALWGPVIGIGALVLGAAAVSAAWWVRRPRSA